MHLILPLPTEPAPTLDALPATLQSWLRTWRVVQRREVDDEAVHAPHEQAWVEAVGGSKTDVASPPYAHAAAAIDGVTLDADRAWAIVTPVHWRVTLDRVGLVDAARLGLDDAESRALAAALTESFDAAGVTLRHGHADRWYAAHPSFDGLITTSIERMTAFGVEERQPRGEPARVWMRLQNECQMVLHDHPLNTAREARGALAINSLWLHGTGVRPNAPLRGDVRIDQRLRRAVPGTDAWRDAALAIERDVLGPQHASMHATDRLVVAGHRAAVTLAPPATGWWQRLRTPRHDATALLASL